jgi:hypothetical protein
MNQYGECNDEKGRRGKWAVAVFIGINPRLGACELVDSRSKDFTHGITT